MYSEKITQIQLEKLESKLGVKLQRHSLEKCEEWSKHLSSLVKEVDQKTGEVKGLKRALRQEESEFIKNEFYICKVDFQYWTERYAEAIRDPVSGGGRGKIKFWDSQRKLLDVMGQIEEKNFDALQKNSTIDGVKIALNKARQLGATLFSRCLMMHRLTLWEDHRAMAASIDDDKIMELYDRDKLILDSLPFYLRPAMGFDVKGQHIYFDKINSRVLYQQSQQQSGLGQGRQFELGHITECASFRYYKIIIQDFLPTLPQGFNTLCILESTPQGRDNWWLDFVEDIRDGHRVGWTYVFIPWYIESRKYRRDPPEGWNPSELSLLHAKRVADTSPDIVGRKVILDKSQLYWYETERYVHQKAGELNLFLTNYCATHDESFQYIEQSLFSTEVIEELRLNTKVGIPYELESISVQ